MTLNPPTDLRDLMFGGEMFARLVDDMRQEKKAIRTTFQGEGPFKKLKESLVDYES